MAREKVQTRADADTVSALDEYAEEVDLSESEVVRRALRRYLAEEGYPVAVADGAGVVNSRIDDLEAEVETTVGGLEDALKDRLDELEEREAERYTRNRKTRFVETVLYGLGVVYVALSVAFVPLGETPTYEWIGLGVVTSAALLAWTWYTWGGDDE